MIRDPASQCKNSFLDYTCLTIPLISRSLRKLGCHSAEIILMLQFNQDSVGIWIWFSNTMPLLQLRFQILVSISTFKERCWLITYHERTLLSSWLKCKARRFLYLFFTWGKKKSSFIVQNTNFLRNLSFLGPSFPMSRLLNFYLWL